MITLTTDFGNKDHYVPIVKGILLKNQLDLKIIDITHQIEVGNVMSAAYIIKNILPYYPSKTFHIIDVGGFEAEHFNFIFFQIQDQFIICPDNGIYTLINPEENPKPFLLIDEDVSLKTFPLLNHLNQIMKLYQNTNLMLSTFEEYDNYVIRQWLRPVTNEAGIVGHVIHIDANGNLHTNITKDLFDKVVGKKTFKISVKGLFSNKINDNFFESKDGSEIYFFDMNNYIQISMKNASAAHLFGANQSDPINIVLN